MICGARLQAPRKCPGCGADNAPQRKRCLYCGEALAALSEPAPRPPPPAAPRANPPAALRPAPRAASRPSSGRGFASGLPRGRPGPARPGLSLKNIACLGLVLALFGFCGFGNLFWWVVAPPVDPRPSARLRLHVYNSSERPLTVELRARSLPRSDPPERRFTLPPGGAQGHLARHADTLDIRVIGPDGLSHLGQEVAVAPEQAGNLIVDLGARGTFYRMPVTYFPEFWTRDAQQTWLAGNSAATEETFGGGPQHMVHERVDYGLGVPPPDRQETSRDQPFVQWKLASEEERIAYFLDALRRPN